ncbi:MAG: MFS transporter [Lentisphaeria bacterium]|nr:MFS transporter [Lentisphaeria bacterium]
MNNAWMKSLALVGMSQFLSSAAFCSAYTFMPFYFKEIGVTEERLSWYVALFVAFGTLSFALAAPVWGVLADKYGRKLMLLRANFAAALLLPIIGFITDVDWIIVHRIALGVLTGTVPAAQTLMLGMIPSNKRTFVLGVLSSCFFSGMMVGQFGGGEVVTHLGFMGTFWLSGIILATAGLLVLPVKENMVRPQPASEKEQKSGKKSWLQIFNFGQVWYLMILCICMTASRDLDGAFIPVLVDKIMGDNAQALRWSGYIFGSCSAVAIVMGTVIGWIADRTKMLNLLLILTALSVLMRIPQIFTDSVAAFLIYRCLLAAAACGIEPMLNSWIAATVPAKDHGRYFGIAGAFRGLGWSLSSLLGGGVILACNNEVRSVFALAAFLMLLMLPLIVFVSRRLPMPDRSRKQDSKT